MNSKKGMRGLFFCLMVMALLWVFPGRAEAAKSYRKLFEDYESTTDRVGSMQFRKDTSYGKYQYWDSRNQRWVYLDTWGPILCNGTYAYYVGAGAEAKCEYLYRLTGKSGKLKKLKKLKLKTYSSDSTDSYMVSAVYGNQVFVTRSSFDEWKYETYMYQVKKKTWKKVLSHGLIESIHGKYVAVDRDFRSDVSPTTHLLYKIRSSGLKKIRRLAKSCYSAEFVGKKLYYSAYSGSKMVKVTIYRCNPNGSGKKKLGTIKSNQEYGMVIPREYTSKSCRVYVDGQDCVYTYRTKKLTPSY